ncbi:MAG: 3-oxoacyl-ACP reductase FabG [Chloroflexi bacterium]|nr:3-oxoacyl-ACP reductase FabG [Chloroflexota bacterium]
MFELNGYAAIVTGGARGIGRAIAIALADAGSDVLITYKGNTAAADAVVAEITAKGRKAAAMQADAADPDSAVAVVAKAMESFGKVDLLVNNAGITRDTLILRMTPEQWREVIDTNLSGAFYMTKAAVREMLRAKSGRIVNITSVSSRGITVNAVAPGFIVTELTADLPEAIKEGVKTATPLGRFGEPHEIAAAVIYLASREASYVTGQVLGVDGGLVMM